MPLDSDDNMSCDSDATFCKELEAQKSSSLSTLNSIMQQKINNSRESSDLISETANLKDQDAMGHITQKLQDVIIKDDSFNSDCFSNNSLTVDHRAFERFVSQMSIEDYPILSLPETIQGLNLSSDEARITADSIDENSLVDSFKSTAVKTIGKNTEECDISPKRCGLTTQQTIDNDSDLMRETIDKSSLSNATTELNTILKESDSAQQSNGSNTTQTHGQAKHWLSCLRQRKVPNVIPKLTIKKRKKPIWTKNKDGHKRIISVSTEVAKNEIGNKCKVAHKPLISATKENTCSTIAAIINGGKNKKQNSVEQAVAMIEAAQQKFLARLDAKRQEILCERVSLANENDHICIQEPAEFTLSQNEELQNMTFLRNVSTYYRNDSKNKN